MVYIQLINKISRKINYNKPKFYIWNTFLSYKQLRDNGERLCETWEKYIVTEISQLKIYKSQLNIPYDRILFLHPFSHNYFDDESTIKTSNDNEHNNHNYTYTYSCRGKRKNVWAEHKANMVRQNGDRVG